MTTASQIRLDGVIDMHVHTAPDVIQRTYNDLELTDAAVRTGARAIVMKGHHCPTVARAALCIAYNRKAHPDNAFFMFGGLVLNREAGGLNPAAVQTALAMGAKVIWLPTVDAANEYRKRGKSGGIQMTDERGFLLPELREICKLIKEYDAVLERCFRQPLPNGQWVSNVARNAEAIRQLGADNTILSTDCGDPADPPWEYAMAQYLHDMEAHGVSCDALRRMTQTLPAQLLSLEDAAE